MPRSLFACNCWKDAHKQMELQQQLIYSHPVHPEHDTKLKASTTLALLHDWPHFIINIAGSIVTCTRCQPVSRNIPSLFKNKAYWWYIELLKLHFVVKPAKKCENLSHWRLKARFITRNRMVPNGDHYPSLVTVYLVRSLTTIHARMQIFRNTKSFAGRQYVSVLIKSK